MFCFVLFISGCDIDDELLECSYNARMEYWYTDADATNRLPEYIYRTEEFVFDANGVLRQMNTVAGKGVDAAELRVPPGTYTLVTWANIERASHIGKVEIGKTKKEEMMVYLDYPYQPAKAKAKTQMKTKAAAASYHGNSEALFYGETEFTVTDRGVSRQRVDLVHSHFRLNLVVCWKSKPPDNTGNFNLRLYEVPAAYYFTEATEIPLSAFNRSASDGGEAAGANRVGHIPRTTGRVCNHRVDAKMGLSRRLSAEFVTYRLSNSSHPRLCVYAGDTPLMKEIDLYTYFRTKNIDLDRNLRQEFTLEIEIEHDRVNVSTVEVSDWEDGGSIGSNL